MEKISEQFAELSIAEIATRMTFHSYSISRLGVKDLFKKMTAADYMTLTKLRNASCADEQGKLYLSEIAKVLELPMRNVARLVSNLKERGIVAWKHDGIGENGTYIQFTDKGEQVLTEQQEVLQRFYTAVIERFGKEQFVQLLHQVEELEEIMHEEIEGGIWNGQ